jgi:hypothetical protein
LARQRLRLLLNHAHGVRPPSLQRRGPLDDRGAGQGRNAVAHQGLGAQGWSVYGAKRAQPAATDGECEGLATVPEMVRRGRRFESVRGLQRIACSAAACVVSEGDVSERRCPRNVHRSERQRVSDAATAVAERACGFCGDVHLTSTRRNRVRRRQAAPQRDRPSRARWP